jgi:multicomponent Na+:H+ antiporter subunit E
MLNEFDRVKSPGTLKAHPMTGRMEVIRHSGLAHDLGLDDEAEFQRRYSPRHLWHAIPLLIGMLAVWVIMNEHFNLITIVSGLIVGIIALLVTHLVIGRSYTDELWLGFRAGLIFIPYLIWQIVLAAAKMVKVILTGQDHFVEYVYHSTLEDDFSVFLFATSIILTPGSMSLSRDGNDILVLSIDQTVEDGRAGCAALERGIAGLNNPIFGARPVPHNPRGVGVPHDSKEAEMFSQASLDPTTRAGYNEASQRAVPEVDPRDLQPGVHDELS